MYIQLILSHRIYFSETSKTQYMKPKKKEWTKENCIKKDWCGCPKCFPEEEKCIYEGNVYKEHWLKIESLGVKEGTIRWDTYGNFIWEIIYETEPFEGCKHAYKVTLDPRHGSRKDPNGVHSWEKYHIYGGWCAWKTYGISKVEKIDLNDYPKH